MDVRNSALVVTVSVTVCGAIALAAALSFAVYHRSIGTLIPSQSQPSAVRSRLSRERLGIPARPPGTRAVFVENRRRTEQLEAQLEQRTLALKKKTALLNKTAAEHRELELELERYTALAAELMAESFRSGEGENLERREPDAAKEEHDSATELQRLKEELARLTLLGTAMEMELSELNTELSNANQQGSEIQGEAERAIALLLAEDSTLRDAAARTLGQIGAQAVPALVELLGDGNAAARGWAAEMLGEIGPDAREAIPSLIEALADADESVRVRAKRALSKIRD